MQLLANLQNGIGTRRAVVAGGAKAAGIEHQYPAVAMAKQLVGVAVDHAVCLGKMLPEGSFNIQAQAGTVGQADGKATEDKHFLGGKECPCCPIAHITVYSMKLFIAKNLQDTGAGDVTRVDDDIAIIKTVLHLLAKAIVRYKKMGVAEDASSDGHEKAR